MATRRMPTRRDEFNALAWRDFMALAFEDAITRSAFTAATGLTLDGMQPSDLERLLDEASCWHGTVLERFVYWATTTHWGIDRAPRPYRDALVNAAGGATTAERIPVHQKIYLASSWRNERQPELVRVLRAAGHEVYDFRDHGFSWRAVDPDWQHWTAKQQIAAVDHPIAEFGLALDYGGMQWANVCVMLQPCGRSAALELGWAIGAGKRTAVLMADGQEAELMLRLADLLTTSVDELLAWLAAA